jgi:hypothetical protein
MPDGQFLDNDYCFACGTLNPLGLHLHFHRDGERYCTRVTPSPHWQGFAGIVHGGLQSTIFDDLMSNHLFRVLGVWATTGELAVRFRRPVPLDVELLFISAVASHQGRVWTLSGECRLAAVPDSPALSTAIGRFVEVPYPGLPE